MVFGRRITKRKGQQLVALPPEVRTRMEVIPGQWLYFHLGRKGEVVLSTSPARAGGQPPTATLEVALSKARARIDELERKLAGGFEAARRDVWNELAASRFRVQLKGVPALDAINDRLRRIEDQLAIRRGPWSYRAKRAAPSRSSRPVETVDAPVLSKEETREQIDAAARRFGPGIGFALPPGVVAVELPPPDPDPSSP
jgi:hypothetical protein